MGTTNMSLSDGLYLIFLLHVLQLIPQMFITLF